jgi:hypothetical protein
VGNGSEPGAGQVVSRLEHGLERGLFPRHNLVSHANSAKYTTFMAWR